MKTVISNIHEASEKNLWWSADPCNSNIVHCCANECMMSAATGAGSANNDGANQVFAAICRISTKLLLDSPSYKHLGHFVQFYKTKWRNCVKITSTLIIMAESKLQTKQGKTD